MTYKDYNLDSFVGVNKHDKYVIEAIKEAIDAANEGNYGIGAVLVDKNTGEIIMRSHNKIFSTNRSDFHAEMSLITAFEDKYKEKSREILNHSILVTSLEPCPMCLCRLITAGLNEVYHAADDNDGGMVHLYSNLPPTWQKISYGRIFGHADCSNELSNIAYEVFLKTQSLDNRL